MVGFDGISIKKVMLYVFLALLIGFVSGFLMGYFQKEQCPSVVTTVETAPICPRYECLQITRDATFEVLSQDKEVSGTGNLFGGNAKVSIPIKNTDAEGASFIVGMICETLQRIPTNITSQKQYIGPNQTATFDLEYEISARENWKCMNFTVNAQAVKACDLKEVTK